MQTLKLELAVAGIALFALGAFVAMRPTDAEAAAAQPVAVRAFSEADFNVFDRGFLLDDVPCAVGLERHSLCFAPAPIEHRIALGMAIPNEVPLIAAEFRVIVETDLKDPALRTVRFGQTLALVDPDSRVVVDMMRLSAPTLEEARRPAPAAL